MDNIYRIYVAVTVIIKLRKIHQWVNQLQRIPYHTLGIVRERTFRTITAVGVICLTLGQCYPRNNGAFKSHCAIRIF